MDLFRQRPELKHNCAIVFKSDHIEHPVVFECNDYTLAPQSIDDKDNLVLKLYGVSAAHMNGVDILMLLNITKHAPYQLKAVHEGHIAYLYGEMNEKLINTVNVKIEQNEQLRQN